MHEFWARNKFVQAKFVLVKLCTSMFSKIRASEILSTCYPRNGVYLKIRASEIHTSEIRASQVIFHFEAGPLGPLFLNPITKLQLIVLYKIIVFSKNSGQYLSF